MALSLAEIRKLPSRTQITRHDCVEGWSAIGEWTGARLSTLLEAAHLLPSARYVVFHCAVPMEKDATSLYYESVDLEDAFHPQTILAYDLNGKSLPVKNGAPLRLRLERSARLQNGEVCHERRDCRGFLGNSRRKGGYWEDQGYEWYAGI